MSVTGSLDLLHTAKPATAWSETAATPDATPDTALAAGDAILIPAGATLTITSSGAAPIVATIFSVTSETPIATPLP